VLRLAIRAIKPRKPIGAGVLSPADERQRLADDENGPYAGLDVNDLPDPPDMSDADLYGEHPDSGEHDHNEEADSDPLPRRAANNL
jgi:hypothetical protein